MSGKIKQLRREERDCQARDSCDRVAKWVVVARRLRDSIDVRRGDVVRIRMCGKCYTQRGDVRDLYRNNLELIRTERV